MNPVVEKIKFFVQCPSRQDGIKGLMKLQAQLPQNLKYKTRLACLHLMEMNHDWQGIMKLISEWKLAKSFGKQLVIRMRKRVNEDPGQQLEDPQLIVKQLDRLNDKNWRQFSPKKTFPDYLEQINQQNKQIKRVEEPKAQNKKISRGEKQSENKTDLKKQQKVADNVFSRLSNIHKGDKLKQIQIPTKGVFSKTIIANKSQAADKKQGSQTALPAKQSKQNSEINLNNTEARRQESSNSQSKKLLTKPRVKTPMKQSKKIISVKYGQKQKIKQQSREQFSFSAVKAMQIQSSISQKKGREQPEDNSFLNFTNESKIIRNKAEQATQNKSNIFQDFNYENEFKLNRNSIRQKRPLFTQQQLNLIELNKPPKDYIKNIIKCQGRSPMQLLRSRLKQI